MLDDVVLVAEHRDGDLDLALVAVVGRGFLLPAAFDNPVRATQVTSDPLTSSPRTSIPADRSAKSRKDVRLKPRTVIYIQIGADDPPVSLVGPVKLIS